VESLENHADECHLAKTDASAGYIVVDLDEEELSCGTEVGNVVFLLELHVDINCCIGGRLHTCVHHGDIIDAQVDDNAITADFKVMIRF
jgi:hypothetical protein